MDYDQALDEVISAAVWWYCTDTNQRRLRNALDIVISRVDEVQADTGLIAWWTGGIVGYLTAVPMQAAAEADARDDVEQPPRNA